VLAIWIDPDDGAKHAGAIEQAEMRVEGVAVRIAQFSQRFLSAVEINAKDLIQALVAHIEQPRRIPDRAFGKAESIGDSGEFRVVIDKIPELRRERHQFEFPRSAAAILETDQEEASARKRGRGQPKSFRSGQPFHTLKNRRRDRAGWLLAFTMR